MENFAKITFLSFSTTVDFLHDVMVPEKDVLEAGSAVGVFTQIVGFNCKWSESEQWRSQSRNLGGPEILGGGKMFDFRRITLL